MIDILEIVEFEKYLKNITMILLWLVNLQLEKVS